MSKELTKKELTALCRKQEEYIKELEEKLKQPELNDTEKCCEEERPDYDELYRQVLSLDDKIFKLGKENEALRYSLTKMYIQLEGSQSREAMWEEDYYKEHKRAEKLFEELNN